MKSFVITFLSLLAVWSAFAFNISGVVTDSAGDPLVKATVRVLRADSSAVKGAITDLDGKFTITDIPKGRYRLEATYVGFAKTFVPVRVAGKNLKVDTIVMHEDAALLKDLTVTGIQTPIRVAEDTVEFNASSYRTQPNAVVEDLLKRLPGVEVGSDGSITANGKTVTKILVDGKEFFSDDPKVASKNLPVDMIDRLQVVDRKSDLARLTGVDDGEEETVINLTVKKDRKNGWFGNAEAGYGTDDRYRFSLNVNRFWDGNQLTVLAGANNVNDMGFNDGGGRFRRFGGGNGITTAQWLGVNFNVGKEEIIRVGGDVLYSHTQTDNWRKSTTEYLLTDNSRTQNTERTSLDKGHNFRADFRIEWKPDSFNTLDIRPNVSLNFNDSESSESGDVTMDRGLTNRSLNLQRSHGSSYEFGARLIYNHNFKSRRGRSFSVMANINTSNVREKENAYSLIRYYLYGDSIDEYDQFTTDHTWTNRLAARVSWTEPLGDVRNGNFLTFAYRLQYRWNNADKLTYDRPLPDIPDGASINDIYDLPLWTWDLLPGDTMLDSLSNRFRNDYMNQDLRIGFRHVSKVHRLNVGISFVPQMSKSIDLIDDNKSIPRRWVWNFAPFLRYRKKITKTRSITSDYEGRSSQPSLTQLQPVPDMSDPLNIKVGNPDLDPSFTHNVRFRFQDFNQDAQRSIMVSLDGSLTQNSIISKTTFSDNGGRVTTYENVGGVWNVRAFSMFSMPFKRKTFTFNNFLHAGYNRSVGYNNGVRNNAGDLSVSEGFNIAFRPDNLELELGPEYRLQYTTNSVASNNDRTVHRYGFRFNAVYYTPFGIVLNSNLRYSATSGYGDGYDTDQWMWNASIGYQALKDKSLTITLSANDILNQRSNISRSVTGNYIQDSMYKTLTRYMMLSVSYRFNTFGKGGIPEGRDERRVFGPGPGRPGRPPRF